MVGGSEDSEGSGKPSAIPLTDSQKASRSPTSTADPITEMLQKIDQGAGGFIRMPDQITNPEIEGPVLRQFAHSGGHYLQPTWRERRLPRPSPRR